MISSVVRDSFTFLNTAVKAHYRGEGTSPEHFIYSKSKWMDQSKGVDYSAWLVSFMYCIHTIHKWHKSSWIINIINITVGISHMCEIPMLIGWGLQNMSFPISNWMIESRVGAIFVSSILSVFFDSKEPAVHLATNSKLPSIDSHGGKA